MFGSLIRRKQTQRPLGEDDIAFESTTFSLSTAVPKPAERRADERLMAMLRVAKVSEDSGREQLIRVRNVSAGGLMAEVGHPVQVGDTVCIELSSQKIHSTVVWIREGTAGFKFDQNIDLGELLAGPDGELRPTDEREAATVAISTMAAAAGAWAVRVHESRATADAVRVVARTGEEA